MKKNKKYAVKDKHKKCVVCQEKNAWTISPTVTNVPIYCRKCYSEKILKLKYLTRFCDKCGHKINTCQKSGSKNIICYGCWFKRNNIHKNTIQNFYNYITTPSLHHLQESEGYYAIMDYMGSTFDINECSCCFIYTRKHRC